MPSISSHSRRQASQSKKVLKAANLLGLFSNNGSHNEGDSGSRHSAFFYLPRTDQINRWRLVSSSLTSIFQQPTLPHYKTISYSARSNLIRRWKNEDFVIFYTFTSLQVLHWMDPSCHNFPRFFRRKTLAANHTKELSLVSDLSLTHTLSLSSLSLSLSFSTHPWTSQQQQYYLFVSSQRAEFDKRKLRTFNCTDLQNPTTFFSMGLYPNKIWL